MTIEEEVRQLASQVPMPPNERLPAGATDEAISAFERRTGLSVPPSLRDWLHFSNGPCIGPGGLLGIHPERTSLDIEEILQTNPVWREKGWLPVAGDGCGNYYIVNTKENGSVYFIDTAVDGECLAYSVASGVWPFLWFLLMRELGHKGWPFSFEYVVSRDSSILRCACAPLPWAE